METAFRENNLRQEQPPLKGARADNRQPKQPDTASDRATAAFVRRVLCSHDVLLGNGEKGRNTPRPIEDVLPPLTSSNEVDLQLYAIIAVIIKEFVQTWYSKITPDHVFVNEVIQIIAHCTRGLEQRLRKVDLEALLLDEIPELVEAHLHSFRLAKQQASDPHSLVSDPRTVYHTLRPHPALSPPPDESIPSSVVEQRENESAWRQLLVQGVLVVLLPTEDLENACLRSLVAEVFAEMILGNGISGKACEGWLLWEGITRIAEVLQTDHEREKGSGLDDTHDEKPLTRLQRYGLLAPATEQQSGDGSSSPRLANANDDNITPAAISVSSLFWSIILYVFMAGAAMRVIITAMVTASAWPRRCVAGIDGPSSVQEEDKYHPTHAERRRQADAKRPIVNMKVWSFASELVELDFRMPWMSGFLSMVHYGALAGPGRVGDTNGVLDRFLSHTLHTRVLNPAFLPIVLRTLRATLFPNNTLAPPRQPPSADEAKQIKWKCAAAILELLPVKVVATFFATSSPTEQLRQVEELLDCLDDAYLNKHLIFEIVELIVLRLVPELGERGVQELMEDRLG